MTRAGLEYRVQVLEEAIGFRDRGHQNLTPQQGRIANVLARGPLPSNLLAEVIGINTPCLRRHITAMRQRGVRVTFSDGAYRMEA